MRPAAVLLADSDTGKGSPIGLLVVLLLVIAVYFLWRSMNRHLKKVQPTDEEQFDPFGADSAATPESIQPPDRTEAREHKIENGQQPQG